MIMKSHVILCFIGCMIIQGDTTCPDKWLPFQGSCYLFAFDQRLPFNEAQHFCLQHGANLVHMKNEHESNFLRNFISHLIPYPWWIGLNDQQIEGEYRWIDTDAAPSYTDWETGNPDSVNHTHNEDCVCLQPQGYRWHDVDCIAPFKPICEKLSSNGVAVVG